MNVVVGGLDAGHGCVFNFAATDDLFGTKAFFEALFKGFDHFGGHGVAAIFVGFSPSSVC